MHGAARGHPASVLAWHQHPPAVPLAAPPQALLTDSDRAVVAASLQQLRERGLVEVQAVVHARRVDHVPAPAAAAAGAVHTHSDWPPFTEGTSSTAQSPPGPRQLSHARLKTVGDRIPAGVQRSARRAAHGLAVVVAQPRARCEQGVNVGRPNRGAAEPEVVPAQVISQDEEDVGRGLCHDGCGRGRKGCSAPHPSADSTARFSRNCCETKDRWPVELLPVAAVELLQVEAVVAGARKFRSSDTRPRAAVERGTDASGARQDPSNGARPASRHSRAPLLSLPQALSSRRHSTTSCCLK